MNPDIPNIKDVARLFSDELLDPAEAKRIMDEIDTSPDLQFFANIFADAILDEQPESSVPIPSIDVPDLRRTRLCRLKPKDDITKLLGLDRFETEVEYEANGLIKSFPLCFVKTDANHFRLEADFPEHLKPVGFVLADFDLIRGRDPFEAVIELPHQAIPPVEPMIDSERRSYSMAAKTEGHTEPGPDTRCFSVPLEENDQEKRKILALKDGRLPVFADSSDRYDDIAVVELFVNPADKAPAHTIPVHVHREHRGGTAEGIIEDFPLSDPAHKEGIIRVRALEYKDAPRLNGEMVTTLLGTEENFAAVPVSADEDGSWNTEFRYDFKKELLTNEKTAWFLRMTEQGGAV